MISATGCSFDLVLGLCRRSRLPLHVAGLHGAAIEGAGTRVGGGSPGGLRIAVGTSTSQSDTSRWVAGTGEAAPGVRCARPPVDARRFRLRYAEAHPHIR